MSAYSVTCRWDEEGGVWYVAESDVPGLATEAESLDELVRKLEDLIPELLEINDQLPATPDIVLFTPSATSTRPGRREWLGAAKWG